MGAYLWVGRLFAGSAYLITFPNGGRLIDGGKRIRGFEDRRVFRGFEDKILQGEVGVEWQEKMWLGEVGVR